MPGKYDRKAMEEMRKDRCEYCGSPARGWPHHIRTRGAGGKDVPHNLIQLCGRCHRDAHDGRIKRRDLIAVVARREGVAEEEIYARLGWVYDGRLPSEVTVLPSTVNPLGGRSLEEVIELYLFCLEKGEDSAWERAAVVTALCETGLSPREIASMLGCSASLCRKFVKTFNAFPCPEDRVPYLSFRHHVIAAYTDDPAYWIARAADESWSTRQMQERLNKEPEEDKQFDKAERALRLAEEVLREPSEAADWLKAELARLLGVSLKIAC